MVQRRLWYVAYGSNLSAERLDRYLVRAPVPDEGGRAPAASAAMVLDHRLFFAHESRVWGGGSAFVDPVRSTDAATRGTAWLLTEDQFWSVFAQENGRRSLDTEPSWSRLEPGATLHAIEGRYGLLLGCPSPDERPALTFTTPARPLPPANPPAPTYVDTIVAGLADGHGLDEAGARAYVARRVTGAPAS